MQFRDLLLAVAVAAIWGTNFVFIQLGLKGVPPLLLCAARFFLVAFPLVFFVPPPKTSRGNVMVYGLTYFALQFGFLFSGMGAGVPAGLASLLLQVQVFFTMALSSLLLKEVPRWWNLAGAMISFAGIAVVMSHAGGECSVAGLVLLLFASLSFATGVVSTRRMASAKALSLVVWGSLVAFFPLLVASLIIEGPDKIVASLQVLSLVSIVSIAYIVYLSTLLGFSLWNLLLRRNPASVVAPFTLLVPVFGFLSSALFLGESFPSWKWQASLLVLLGLSINQFGKKVRLPFFP